MTTKPLPLPVKICITIGMMALIVGIYSFAKSDFFAPSGFQFPLKIQGKLLQEPEITIKDGSAYIRWATKENFDTNSIDFQVQETGRMGGRESNTSYFDENLEGYIHEAALSFSNAEAGYTYLVQVQSKNWANENTAVMSRPYQIQVPEL